MTNQMKSGQPKPGKKRPGDLRTYPTWVHEELMNWSRWCWRGAYPHPLPHTACGSVERNYQRISEEATAENARPIPPNEAYARIVQAAWEAMPHLPRQVLRAEYPQRHESGRVEHGRNGAAVRLQISLEQYEAALSVASYKVMKAFEATR